MNIGRELDRLKQMARIEDLSVDDSVSWSIPKPPQEPSIAHGIIESLNREDETATIRVWAILENGGHSETDRDVEIERLKISITALN